MKLWYHEMNVANWFNYMALNYKLSGKNCQLNFKKKFIDWYAIYTELKLIKSLIINDLSRNEHQMINKLHANNLKTYVVFSQSIAPIKWRSNLTLYYHRYF